MWDRITFKATGKANFKANYWPFVAVSVLYALLFGNLLTLNFNNSSRELSDLISLLAPFAITGFALSFAISLLVANPYEVGASRFYLENTTFHTAPFSRVSVGFSANFGNVVLTQFLRGLYTFLWSLLFIIPGIVRGYGYFAVPYILAENPHIHHKRALELSRAMAMGYKGEIFVTDLSFLGWQILNGLTLGILGVFYVNPYIYATKAEIYRFLRAKAMEQGITSPAELPGMGNL